uniref:Chromatin assembly factor 1 subunit A dimerization domain-containing protein n=3 Tax=Clastoptera arizonana TaxID=38151 RepID=A0A1B6E528_9HEMI
MPFQVKVDMRLAPTIRKELQDPDKHYLDSFLKDPSKTVDFSYIQSLKNGNHKPGNSGKTWPRVVEEDDDVIFVVAENSENDSEVKEENKTKKSSHRHRVKLLQFHDNRRPPYWGTWRKRSLTIHPKRPFQMDKTMLEYEVDSDDEWEDIEDGESLRGSDDEESQDENYEEDNDMFVPHGYLSDEEGQDELDDASPEAMKARLKLLQLEFEAERNEKQERLKPRVIGCVWFKNTDDDPSKVGSHIAELFLPCRAVWEGDLPISLTANATVYNEESPLGDSSSGLKKIQFPETAISKIITLVHGNRHSKFFLVKELRQCFIKNNITPQPSQRSILQKIKELATWVKCPEEEGGPHLTNKMCWYISKEIRKAYGLHDLQARESLTWEYSLTPPKKSIDKSSEGNDSPLQTTPTLSTTPITKFTKFMSLEERQNQLLNDTESKPQSQKSANTSTPLLKKRVSLTSVPTGTDLSKKCKTGLLEKFIQTNCASEKGSTVTKSPSQQSNQDSKKLQKTAKRIKPIPVPREDNKISESDCIVLSD